MSQHDKSYFPLKLTVLTPVSVGSGDTLNALNYVVVKENSEYYLHYLDLERLLTLHSEAPELARQLGNSNYLAIRKTIWNMAGQDIQRYSLGKRLIPDPDFANKIIGELNDAKSENQLLIDEALKNPLTGRLLVPGSSIKGAIRTAVIDFFDVKDELKLKNNYQTGLDNLLGKIGENVFKALKIGDFETRLNDGYVVTCQENSQNADRKQSTPKNAREILPNRLMNQTDYSLWSSGSLGFQKSAHQALVIKKESFDWNRLCEVVNKFYQKRFRDEFQKFYTHPHLQKTRNSLENLMAIVPQKGEMLLRIGHYSHVECMTVTENSPQTPSRSGNKMPYGTTRTLANGLYPFGWVLLAKSSEADLETYQGELSQEWKSALLEREQQINIQKAKQEEQEREKQRAVEQQALEEQKRIESEQRRNSLSEIDRMVEDILHLPDAMPLYQKLESFQGKDQQKLAEAFKQRFHQEGKWEGKQSDKQQKKIERIKQILNQ
ncbi:RAMP superfamily CRISPR-associated protein [Deltaproteobacteria bacterium TL4]